MKGIDWNGAWLTKTGRQYKILRHAMRKAGRDKSFDARDATKWAGVSMKDASILLSIMRQRGILRRVGRGQYEVDRE